MELRHKAGNERRGTTRIHTARRARRGIEGPVLEWTRHAGQARTRGDISGVDSTDTAGHAIGKAAEATLGATTQLWAMQAMKVTDSLGAPGTGRQRQRAALQARAIITRQGGDNFTQGAAGPESHDGTTQGCAVKHGRASDWSYTVFQARSRAKSQGKAGTGLAGHCNAG